MDLVYRPWPVAAIPSRINRVRAFCAGQGFGIYFFAPFRSYTDAFFEAASGFTTTGATILPDVEVLSSDVQFWRHFSHWLGGMAIPETAIASLLNLVYLAFLVNFVSCLLLAATGVDVLTSISAVAAAMFSIGPGLGDVGPAEHYGSLPDLAKWVLSGCMLAGRLEFYTALVILSPSFWRK